MHENRADHLGHNLRLQEISVIIFFQFYSKINRNQLQIVAETTYGLNSRNRISKTEFKILTTKRFGFHSNSRGVDEIYDLPISIDFQIQKHGLVAPV